MTLASTIDAIVGDAIERRVFPGAVVLIAQSDSILHHRPYGATTYEPQDARPVNLTTIYDVASLTKMFTATAALRLYEQGRLDLQAPVAEYLPAIRSQSIRIHHLLTHTSGLDIRLSTLRHAGRAGLLEAVYNVEPVYAPGERVAYTNVNSLLLGEVITELWGASLDTALQELVIAPLGLRDTCFRPPPELFPRIAPTELDLEWRGGLVHGSVHDESAHALGGIAGHAGLFSTTADLHLFCRAWLGEPRNRLLDPATIALATKNHTAGLNAACGLGWMLQRAGFMGAAPPETFGHTGFTGPAMIVIPQRELIIAIVSNRVHPRRGAAVHHPVTAAIIGAVWEHLRDI